MQYQTKILSSEDIAVAAELIRQGECVAFPTETVYGLGANALAEQAVAKIFAAKGRPADNPLIVHLYDRRQLADVISKWPREAEKLMVAFWPGPLTLVLPKSDAVPAMVTGGLDTVAVRIPDHPLALALLKAAGVPVAAPSANISGRPSPTRASHVLHDLGGRIPAIVDGGETGWGLESTVLDCTVQPIKLLRPGAVTLEQLRRHVFVETDRGTRQHNDAAPPSPGMKYRHYSPEARVIVVEGKHIQREIRQQLAHFRRQGTTAVVLAFSENKTAYGDAATMDMGSRGDLKVAASRLYHLLRKADHLGYQAVLVEGLPETDLGQAIMNRLRKAAAKVVKT